MGKKLNFDKQLESLEAIKELYFSWDEDTSVNSRNVEVINKETDEVIIDIQVPINISPGTEFYKINIVWEDAGIGNFNKLKLFGTYWSSYNEMTYDEINEFLLINSSDSDKLVRVYG